MKEMLIVFFIIIAAVILTFSVQNSTSKQYQNQKIAKTVETKAVQQTPDSSSLVVARMRWIEAKAKLDELAVKYGDARLLSPEYLEYQRKATAAMSHYKLERAKAGK